MKGSTFEIVQIILNFIASVRFIGSLVLFTRLVAATPFFTECVHFVRKITYVLAIKHCRFSNKKKKQLQILPPKCVVDQFGTSRWSEILPKYLHVKVIFLFFCVSVRFCWATTQHLKTCFSELVLSTAPGWRTSCWWRWIWHVKHVPPPSQNNYLSLCLNWYWAAPLLDD